MDALECPSLNQRQLLSHVLNVVNHFQARIKNVIDFAPNVIETMKMNVGNHTNMVRLMAGCIQERGIRYDSVGSVRKN